MSVPWELGSRGRLYVRPIFSESYSAWAALYLRFRLIMFMDRISRRSQVAEGVSSGNLRIPSLLFCRWRHFIDFIKPLPSTCKIEFSTLKSEDVVPGEQRVECSLPVSKELLPQVSLSLIYEWRANGKINRDWWIAAVLFSQAGRQGSQFIQSRFQPQPLLVPTKKSSNTSSWN